VDTTDDNQEVTRIPTRADLVKLAQAFEGAGISYIVLGGMAIIEHGLRRTTMDIDLLVDDEPEHVALVCKQLAEVFVDGAAREIDPTDIQTYTVVRINDEITIDLMGKACGIDYDSAKTMIDWVEIDGVKIPFASLELLWKTKQTHREKDALDRTFLRSVLNVES